MWLSPAGVREPPDDTSVTPDESPEPQEQQPWELSAGLLQLRDSGSEPQESSPKSARQHPRSPGDNSLGNPTTILTDIDVFKALFLGPGGGAGLRHRIMESVSGAGGKGP